MTKKTKKSKDMQNHKKPMPEDLLMEEFGSEVGDANASKIYEVMEGSKDKQKNKNKK